MSTFKLPDLGEGLAEAEILEWHVKVGDHVRVDQPMVSVETAKAVVEVPAPFSGVVTALRGAPGDIVPTGAPLIEFDSGTVVGSMPATSDEEFVEQAGALPARGAANGNGGGRAVPAARALAKRLDVDLRRSLRQRPRRIDHDRRCPRERRYVGRQERARGGRRRARIPARHAPRHGAEHVAVARSGIRQHGMRRRRHSRLDPAARLHAAADARDDLRLARGACLECLVRFGEPVANADRPHRPRDRRRYARRTDRAGGAQHRKQDAGTNCAPPSPRRKEPRTNGARPPRICAISL